MKNIFFVKNELLSLQSDIVTRTDTVWLIQIYPCRGYKGMTTTLPQQHFSSS